ncbi:probable G-protein coupled receptor Mth-like 11 [Drosophila willistoni]|uniref:probable G-protein coupled receptor Mth-like 11 n=1 Tax=Drosophila willistoni TaxID=7260 RepID=UPI001F072C5D|nr:probable G-protein coupled receptor Mth-like 11 [Drosophila willistoni]
MCIRNFINRRGTSREIYSDNGTNFKAAEKIIYDKAQTINFNAVQPAFDDIKWKFNPPAAPHMGGAWKRLLYTFVCFDSKVIGNDRIRFKMYPVGLLISCCFYAVTLLIYMSIAKLRNLPGKILICLVSNLFFAYMGIALGQLWPTSNENVCFISGFFVYFCLMAAFSWMNITCFDIWHTFGAQCRTHSHAFRCKMTSFLSVGMVWQSYLASPI